MADVLLVAAVTVGAATTAADATLMLVMVIPASLVWVVGLHMLWVGLLASMVAGVAQVWQKSVGFKRILKENNNVNYK